MKGRRIFSTFTLREAHFRIASDRYEAAVTEIRRHRAVLDDYIAAHPAFLESLEPLPAAEDAPEIVRRMTEAAAAAGVGPMAAVAGAFAQLAGEAAAAAGSADIIIDNGGDLYLHLDHDAVVGIYSGGAFGPDTLAFLVTPEDTPLGICSSSSKLGHSLSLGNCDLATVISDNASLADAAATRLANLVKTPGDLQDALESISSIPGIRGALAVIGDRVGTAGRLPRLIRTNPSSTSAGVTVHPRHQD